MAAGNGNGGAEDVALSPLAWADGPVALGGGAGILVDESYSTLGAIGHDKTGELVGFTAGHCGGPGAQVLAKGADNHGSVGTLASVGDGLDYGVIEFDPAKVTPTANFAGRHPRHRSRPGVAPGCLH